MYSTSIRNWPTRQSHDKYAEIFFNSENKTRQSLTEPPRTITTLMSPSQVRNQCLRLTYLMTSHI